MIRLDSFGYLQSFVSASLMLAILGVIAFVVLWVAPPRSWRLRSWLVAAVLVQGLMVVRAPLHLGLIESNQSKIATSVPAGIEPGIVDVTETEIGRTPVATSGPSSLAGSDVLEPSDSLQSSRRFEWIEALLVIWLAVATGMILVDGARYWRVLRLVRRLEPAPNEWQQDWKWLHKSRRLGRTAFGFPARRCELLVSAAVGPLVVRRLSGYSMVVPGDYWKGLTIEQRRGVMLHELAHLQRGDIWRQMAARMVATLHWFNPIAWWALRQYEQASECACDARVASHGKPMAAGFASALVQLVQWHAERLSAGNSESSAGRGIGFQTMAAPPLRERVSRLLDQHPHGDSAMKRTAIAALAVTIICVSFFQIRLTTAQENDAGDADSGLRVIDERVADQLIGIASRLDVKDETTARFESLLDTPSGRIAVAGYLNALAGQSRKQAQSEAIPTFVAEHFTRDAEGKLVMSEKAASLVDRWSKKSQRLSQDMRSMQLVMADIAERLDTSTEAGGLFKRLLQDPQAPIAVLINEMQGRDTIARFLDKAFQYILVKQDNGELIIVQSQRREIEDRIGKLEQAANVSQRLKRELAMLADEFATKDEAHEALVGYLRNPVTASIVAIQVSQAKSSVREAVEAIHQHFESGSIDTADGLEVADEKFWDSMTDIYARVDRATNMLPTIEERLLEFSETLSTEDELTARLAEQMKNETMAAFMASEIPYAEADAGKELRALLSEVMVDSQGELSILDDRQEALTQKSRELLQLCRRIRRYAAEIDTMLNEFADRTLVNRLGEAGRYTLLDEIRRFAETHRPDPVMLLQEDLLAQDEAGLSRVRDDRREIVLRLVEQSERVRAEGANDDF